MHKNNTAATLAVLAVALFAGVPANAQIVIESSRAELSADEPRRIEIYFVLRNATNHELELMKADSPLAQAVEIKQRSSDAQGKTRVWPVAKLELDQGRVANFSANGRFLQLTGLAHDLRVGQVVPLTLTFEDEPPVLLQLRLEAPAKP